MHEASTTSPDTPRRRRRAFPGDRPDLIGHRGAPAYRPEHTADGYRLAIAQGCDFVEPDVVPSRDGVLVVRHEPMLDGTTDIGQYPNLVARRTEVEIDGHRVRAAFAQEYQWSELQRLRAIEPMPELRRDSARHDGIGRVLRLRDLVELLAGERGAGRSCGLVIELKHTHAFAVAGFDLVDLLERELDGWWGHEVLDGLVIESFERDALRRLHERGTNAAIVALLGDRGGPADRPNRTYAQELEPEGLDALAEWTDGISVATSLLGVHDARTAADPTAGRALVQAAHARDLQVATYTLRPEDRFLPAELAGQPEVYWRGILATGVDAVFADAPDRVRAVIDDV